MSDDKVTITTPCDPTQHAWIALPSRTHEADQTVQWSQAGDPAAWGLRPPAEYAGRPYHWLLDIPTDTPEPWEWVAGDWLCHGDGSPMLATEALGYRYLGPAVCPFTNGRETYPSAQSPEMSVLGLRAVTAERRVAELEARIAAQSATIARLAGVQPVGRAHDLRVPQRSECDIFGYGAPDAGLHGEGVCHTAAPGYLPCGDAYNRASWELHADQQDSAAHVPATHATPLPRKAMR
jgi:hypothetical protein